MANLTVFCLLCFLISLTYVTSDSKSEPFDKANCALRADSGICNAAIKKYYYDPESNSCKEFLYGGCKGNENRFETVEACEAACSESATESN